jgi:hypothetical protein
MIFPSRPRESFLRKHSFLLLPGSRRAEVICGMELLRGSSSGTVKVKKVGFGESLPFGEKVINKSREEFISKKTQPNPAKQTEEKKVTAKELLKRF